MRAMMLGSAAMTVDGEYLHLADTCLSASRPGWRTSTPTRGSFHHRRHGLDRVPVGQGPVRAGTASRATTRCGSRPASAPGTTTGVPSATPLGRRPRWHDIYQRIGEVVWRRSAARSRSASDQRVPAGARSCRIAPDASHRHDAMPVSRSFYRGAAHHRARRRLHRRGRSGLGFPSSGCASATSAGRSASVGTLDEAEWQRHFAGFVGPCRRTCRSCSRCATTATSSASSTRRSATAAASCLAQLVDDTGRLLDLCDQGSGRTPWSRDGADGA